MMLSIKKSSMVKPSRTIPSVEGTFISDLDQEKAISHVPLVYFYHLPNTHSFTSATKTLKDSLSQVLFHFFPLAGRLHFVEGGRVRLECNSAGAAFYEAESTAKIEDFKDFAPSDELRSLAPSVDYDVPIHEVPLLLVQVTEFSCGGISLGIAISHMMVDAPSLSHFITEWGRIARGELLEAPPLLDRSVLVVQDPPTASRFKHSRFEPLPLLIGQSDHQEERNKATTVTMLNLSRNQVQRLKDTANEGRDPHVRPYSRYEAIAGHIWRCASKAREHDPKQTTKLSIAVGLRDRCKLPKRYFGNAVLRETASSRSGDLITKPLGHASSKIRETVDMVTVEYVKSFLNHVKTQTDLSRFRTYHVVGSTKGAFYGNPNMEITSWLGIPMFGIDFGWGKEIYMGPVNLNFDGKGYIFPSPGEDGSISIALRLQERHMKTFIKFFYEDIVNLSKL